MHARQAAQERAKEEAPEGQLYHHCCCCCHSGATSLCRAHGHPGQPEGMMVQTSMRILHVVSMMAGPIKQFATLLFLHLLPIIIFKLTFLVIPRDPTSLQTFVTTISKTAAWCLQGHACSACQKQVKRYKKPIRVNQEKDKTASKMRTCFSLLILPPSKLVVIM